MSQRNSSRWLGIFASAALRRSTPRSSTSTSVPLAVSCRATSAAVNPPPTMTTLRLFSLVAMVVCPQISCVGAYPFRKTKQIGCFDLRYALAKVCNRLGILGARIGLAAELHHVARVRRRQAGIADHPPKHLVGVAAVDRVSKAGLGEQGIDQSVEPLRERDACVGHLAFGEILQKGVGISG